MRLFIVIQVSTLLLSFLAVFLFMAAGILSLSPSILFVVLALLFFLGELLRMFLTLFLKLALCVVLLLDDFLSLFLSLAHLLLLILAFVWCLNVSLGLSIRHIELILAVGILGVDSSGPLVHLIEHMLVVGSRSFWVYSLIVFSMRIDRLSVLEVLMKLLTMRIDSLSVLEVLVKLFWGLTTEILWPAIAKFIIPAAVHAVALGLLAGAKGRWLSGIPTTSWEDRDVGNSGVCEELGHRNVVVFLHELGHSDVVCGQEFTD